ncbi:MAG TPA: protein-tyrosine-phosphatase, partial [Candidatus Sabulitectum sp.]|nr:protein-tyrosine-phosphatase [Candidatus Sabulitectum sp.]HPJ29735.1 protein-tyrosine-phosphatase [Candidatus Sabulitectum sp.]
MTALLTALLLTMAFISGPARWNGIPRVVAVADAHGDFYRFAEVLRHAGLIDGNKDWCGGKTH